MSIDLTQQALNALADAGGASCDWEHIKLKDKQ